MRGHGSGITFLDSVIVSGDREFLDVWDNLHPFVSKKVSATCLKNALDSDFSS